jgi:hypothetical protein
LGNFNLWNWKVEFTAWPLPVFVMTPF